MRVRNGDLCLILALTALAVVATYLFGDASPLRLLLAAPLALFFPGYAVSAALFGNQAPSGTERVFLSAGLSLPITMLVGCGLHLTRMGLSSRPWAWALTVVIAVGSTVAGFRRSGSSREAQAKSRVMRPSWSSAAFLSLGALLAAAAVVIARTPLPAPVEGYTALGVSRAGTGEVQVWVKSGELQPASYVLELRDRRPPRRLLFELDPGQRWERTVRTSEGPVEASLYHDGKRIVYRRVHLGASVAAN